jgi:hypothetical protein
MNSMMRRCGAAVVLSVIMVLANVASAGTQPVVTTDLLRMRWVTSIDVAKDGQQPRPILLSLTSGVRPMVCRMLS